MERYLIERVLPGAGALSDAEMQELSSRADRAAAEVGGLRWIESFVADDRLICIYEAESPALIREHAQRSGVGCTGLEPVRRTISPAWVSGHG